MTKSALASCLKAISIWSLIGSAVLLLAIEFYTRRFPAYLVYKGLLIWALLVAVGLLFPILAVCLGGRRSVLWLSAGAFLEIIVALLMLIYAYGSGFH